MTQESQPQKPGWFELVDGDAPSAQVTKVNKVLPIAAVLVTGAVIATGAFFANASENTQSGVLSSPASVTTVDNSTTTPTAGPATSSTLSAPAGVTAPGIQDPTQGGISKPGHDADDEFGDDDGDRPEHDGDRPEHDGDHHEGREHHERGERA